MSTAEIDNERPPMEAASTDGTAPTAKSTPIRKSTLAPVAEEVVAQQQDSASKTIPNEIEVQPEPAPYAQLVFNCQEQVVTAVMVGHSRKDDETQQSTPDVSSSQTEEDYSSTEENFATWHEGDFSEWPCSSSLSNSVVGEEESCTESSSDDDEGPGMYSQTSSANDADDDATEATNKRPSVSKNQHHHERTIVWMDSACFYDRSENNSETATYLCLLDESVLLSSSYDEDISSDAGSSGCYPFLCPTFAPKSGAKSYGHGSRKKKLFSRVAAAAKEEEKPHVAYSVLGA